MPKQSNYEKPLVSCIVPCYKVERYLKTFLEELPKQTIFDKLEAVLDLNEPSQSELALVEDFKEKYPNRLKTIITNPVQSIGASLNACIDQADGDFIAQWSIDDLRSYDSLEKQANLLLNNEDCVIANGNFLIVNSFPSKKGKFIDHSLYSFTPKEFTRSMVFGAFFMWRKSIIEKAGMFDEQLKSGADFDFAIRLAANGKVEMAYGVIGYFLDEQQGASTRPNSKQPVERTLIELRYGILDKIDRNYVPLVEQEGYKKNIIKFHNEEHPVEKFIPNFQEFLKENGKQR